MTLRLTLSRDLRFGRLVDLDQQRALILDAELCAVTLSCDFAFIGSLAIMAQFSFRSRPSLFFLSSFQKLAICVQDFDDSQFCISHQLSHFAALFNQHETKSSASLVRVSRRVTDDHYASILADAQSSVPAGALHPKL